MTNKVPISRTRQYKILRDMKQRCYNKNHQHYPRYGGRGITICEGWLGKEGAKAFYDWSLSHGYSDDLTIDRINNDMGYCPENCVWMPKQLNSPYNELFSKILIVIYNCPYFEETYLIDLIKQIPDAKQRKILQSELSDIKSKKRRRQS